VTLDDLVRMIDHLIVHDDMSGPVNAVAPGAVTNREFTKSLGGALRRPTLLPLPAFAVRLVLGEMGEALLLSGARVEPQALRNGGYEFVHPTLDEALLELVRGA
jgi:NAD dependent epimerase/dehydratase family enzyme